MPDPSIAIAVVVLVALVEATPAVRVPTGMLLAIALLSTGSELLPIALLGAIGVTIARLTLALAARAGRDRLRPPSPAAEAQRAALRDHLARSPAYTRTTFLLAALPGVPAGFVFPLLGAMRAPLWPALAGTLVGRIPVLALTTAIFTWLGRISTATDQQAAILLAVIAIALLIIRTIGDIDWEHRAATGTWRMRPRRDPFVRVGAFMGGSTRSTSSTPWDQDPRSAVPDSDILEGELLGEEVVGSDDDQADPGPDTQSSLPPSGPDRT